MNHTPFSKPPARTPEGGDGSPWEELSRCAAAAAPEVATLIISGRQPPSLAQSNNNSFCQAIQSSPRHGHLCDPYCGRAFQRALAAGGETNYRCHAGLHCFAVEIDRAETGRRLVAIVGRAFTESKDYCVLEERTRTGDLRDLGSADLFSNAHFASRSELEETARRVKAAFTAGGGDDVVDSASHPAVACASDKGVPKVIIASGGEEESSSVPRALSASGVSLGAACDILFRALAWDHDTHSALLVLRLEGFYIKVAASGGFTDRATPLELDPKDDRLLCAAREGVWLTVPTSAERSLKHTNADEAATRRIDAADEARLFPLVVCGEVVGALAVAGKEFDLKKGALTNFCREIAVPLEVLRLREELARRTRVARHFQNFTERVGDVSPEETYAAILTHSTELMRAERGSLLLYDEAADELAVKAAMGPRADTIRSARVQLGAGVAGGVLQKGRPLVVGDRTPSDAEYKPAPAERSYKTGSFISFPIIIGGTRVGVLNVTDKRGGGAYDELDLGLLRMITPQLALALNCAEWQQKASRFQLLSITDPLTNLLNRRYLEERLAEETERSRRYRYPMSFMMIDIDDFKAYNDRNGHQAGDLALEMTAQNLKSALRLTDVAARYGGEEFSVLLPQTSLDEARIIAERIRRRVERTRYPHGAPQPLGNVTVSIGLSTFTPDTDSPASIINAADRALYTAKRLGKNRVEPHEERG